MIKKRKHQIYLKVVVMVIMGMGISNLFLGVSAQSYITDSPHIFIESRFKLWDLNEKMLDKDFNITILYYNQSNNNSFNYKITLDENIYTGNSTYYYSQNFTIDNTDILFKMEIEINNITYLSETGILITSGITQSKIQNSGEPFTINLNPAEWSKKEWNIFFSLMFAGILGMIISYKLVKRIRKKHGVKTIQ